MRRRRRMQTYSFCETVAATGPWHIRILSEIGHKYNGGADTKTLCGLQAAWDVQHEFKDEWIDDGGPLLDQVCQSCLTVYRKEVPMRKYTYTITVPTTTSVNVVVDSDEEIRDMSHAYDLALNVISKADTRFHLKNKRGYESDVYFGEEIEFHEYLNRGNVCYAVCSEISWEEEERQDEPDAT